MENVKTERLKSYLIDYFNCIHRDIKDIDEIVHNLDYYSQNELTKTQAIKRLMDKFKFKLSESAIIVKLYEHITGKVFYVII